MEGRTALPANGRRFKSHWRSIHSSSIHPIHFHIMMGLLLGGLSSAEGFFLCLMFLLHCSETISERYHIPLQSFLLQIVHFARLNPFPQIFPCPASFPPSSRLRIWMRVDDETGTPRGKRLRGRRAPHRQTKGVGRPIRLRRRHRIRRHPQTLRVGNQKETTRRKSLSNSPYRHGLPNTHSRSSSVF
ncbi:uncharacterized protein LY79DRAFT_573786 [Colletotrichum navitas]|uniref:Uncharacterized protein n=1 Tax=Colletotrichum navitas TaxID=681940 RepID=A0AAD8PIU0_9PEZI|nr:uncharacterized protein LY79DRAFT_573786 [Colletotrichum navitas]KAK1564029.1 hypothetical protein LY79DRAFT_573786 [Colletotrichum navitas]